MIKDQNGVDKKQSNSTVEMITTPLKTLDFFLDDRSNSNSNDKEEMTKK